MTGLKGEHRIDDWWKENKKCIKRMHMSFKGYACITTIRGRNDRYGEECRQSKAKVWALVMEHCTPEAWTMTPGWYEKVPQAIAAYLNDPRRIGSFFHFTRS